MKLLYTFFAIFCSFIIVVSCQREVEIDVPTRPMENDSIYISKYIEIDTTYPSGADTVLKHFFTYDGQKRFTKEIIFVNHRPGSATCDTIINEWFYNGSDTLPARTTSEYLAGIIDFADDTIFHTYQNGMIVRDSFISRYRTFPGISWSIFTYTPSGNNIIRHVKTRNSDPSMGPDEEWQGTIFITTNNGNIVTQEDTCVRNISYTNFRRFDVTYDNHPNPFQRTVLPHRILPSSQKNNWLTMTVVSGSGHRTDQTSSFKYRADGYPLIRTYLRSVKGFYFYTD